MSKMEGGMRELEETAYWLELLSESGFFPKDGLAAVRKETGDNHQSQVQTSEILLTYPLSLILYP